MRSQQQMLEGRSRNLMFLLEEYHRTSAQD